MKKTFMSALALTIVLISCQKQEVVPQAEVLKESTIDSSNPTQSLSREFVMRKFLKGSDELLPFCWYPGNDCLPTIIIRPSQIAVLGDVVTIIEENIPSAIVLSFIDHKSVLTEYIDVLYIDGVIKGEYTVESVHGEENAEYLQFKDHEGELISVTPIVINE